MIEVPGSQHVAAITAATRPISRPRLELELDGIGEYRLYERLGTGGYASVYRARRIGEADACDLALKRLHPHLTTDEPAIRAFGREARLAYLLDHPVIRRVYSLRREPGELFMTMEYIDGVSVFELLRRASAARSRLPLAGILALLHRLCGALHYAHELVDEVGVAAGFVHRDVSPSNLLIASGGRLKLIDMGVASSRIDEQATGSRNVRVQGKYGYMAPEVMLRAPFDRRADVFSVGVVAWELLTLCRLYPVSKPPVDIELVRSRRIEAPSTFNRRCPAELDAIVTRALEREPRARWPSCAAMADALTVLAFHLHESLSDAAIADLVDIVDDPETRPRLARGTSPPTPIVAPEIEIAPVPRPSARCGRALAVSAVGGSLATLLVAGIVQSSAELPEPIVPAVQPVPATAPFPALAPIEPIAPRPPMPRPPAPLPATSNTDAPLPLEGRPPQSWSGAYAYRARLCIDVDGSVRSVAVLEGPPRLQTRIERALRLWRYPPAERATCFDVRANVEWVTGR